MILFVLYVILSTSGLLLVKLGSAANAIKLDQSLFSFSMSITSMIGFLCYMSSFVLWMVIISKSEVSYIVPLGVAFTNIAILVGSRYILHEQINLGTIIGTLIIIFGVIVIQFSK